MNHEENAIEYELQLTPLALEMLAAVKYPAYLSRINIISKDTTRRCVLYLR